MSGNDTVLRSIAHLDARMGRLEAAGVQQHQRDLGDDVYRVAKSIGEVNRAIEALAKRLANAEGEIAAARNTHTEFVKALPHDLARVLKPMVQNVVDGDRAARKYADDMAGALRKDAAAAALASDAAAQSAGALLRFLSSNYGS